MAFQTYDKAGAPDLVSSNSVMANKLDAFVSGSSVQLAPYTESATFDVGYYESGGSAEGKASTAARKIVNVKNPDADTDAANKSYVDMHSIGYSITSTKITPASNNDITCAVGQFAAVGEPERTPGFNYSIASHDLTLLLHQYIGVPSIMTTGISGSMDVTTKFTDRCEYFTFQFPCDENYVTDETIQKPVMVIGRASDGTPYYFGYACFDSTGPTTLVQGTLWTTGETTTTSPGSVQKLWFYS